LIESGVAEKRKARDGVLKEMARGEKKIKEESRMLNDCVVKT